jgi:FlaA1/EpsC-like NDP-sugar epimerase
VAFWGGLLLVLAVALLPAQFDGNLPVGQKAALGVMTFALLAALGYQAWPGQMLAVFWGLLAFGGLLEILQSFSAYRRAEWADLLADVLGCLLGWWLGQGLAALRRSKAASLAELLLRLPRPLKRLMALALDAVICVFSVWLVIALRLEQWVGLEGPHWWAVGAAVALALPLFVVFGLYRAIFRYSGLGAVLALVKAFVIFFPVYALVFAVMGVPGVPRSVGLSVPLLLFMLIAGSRMVARFWLGGLYGEMMRNRSRPRALVYGAGASGQQLAHAIAGGGEMAVLGYLDDAPELQGHRVDDLPVHAPTELARVVRQHGITDVLLALPSASRQRKTEVLNLLQAQQLRVRTLPRLGDFVSGRVQVADLRELEIEDLLGREPVKPNGILLNKNNHGKVVLVTGAGGSIGSELCRQVLDCNPETLLLVEHNEYSLYALERELRSHLAQKSELDAAQLVPLLASVRDLERMREIMFTWTPDTVYHAAAYKHVPLVEQNPAEGLRNNVQGTWHAAQAAIEAGVSDFVLISTDKAVRPTNVMGASKRLAEMVLQSLAVEHKGTRFSMVRFGNVLGSSGSVVPLFRQQIKQGGPITLTHLEVTRYFMTIPEAVQLVIQAGAMAGGGEVFVLDMGEPVRISDLARRMVEFSGLKVRSAEQPDGDIELQVVGLRPGEKLYEELLIGENPQPTLHPRILKAHEDFLPWSELTQVLEVLASVLAVNDVDALRAMLQEVVHGYQPADEIADLVYRESEFPAHAAEPG